MKNCTTFAKYIIELLREEEQRAKLGKSINTGDSTPVINTNNNNPTTPDSADIKRSSTTSSEQNKLRGIIFNFKKNLDCDIFAEEFISYEGIKYLLSFLQTTSGNMSTYTLEGLNRLLDFQSSNDYINKNDEMINTLYEILMKSNDNINSNTYSLNVLLTIIYQDKSKVRYLLDIAEDYAKRSVTKPFSQIVRLLSSVNDLNLRSKILILINILLNFCDEERLPKLIVQLKEAGIYEALEKIAKNLSKNNNTEFQEQLTYFQVRTGKIISGSEYELQTYKNTQEKMEKECEEVEAKYEETIEKQIMYEKIIEELLTYREMMFSNKDKKREEE